MDLDFSGISSNSEDIQSQDSIQQEIQNIENIDFEQQERLANFCFDENILLLLKYVNQNVPQEQCLILFNLLNEQMMLESEAIIKQIQPLLQSSLQEFKNGNGNKAEIRLYDLFKIINTLDFQKISDQISQSDDSSKDIKDKDIVMVLGNSGAGKSTFIHYVAGSKIQKVIGQNGLYHWEISKPLYQSLDRVISNSNAKSETKFVIPIQIKVQDQEQSDSSSDDEDEDEGNEEVTICDTPGFKDSEGKESEIANLTGITKCISVCQSIKPVVIISEKQISDRGQGIKEIANVIKKMLKPSKDSHKIIKNFLFVFSKFEKDEDKKQFHKKLKNIKEHLNTEEKKDKEFVYVLKTMIKQTKIYQDIAFFDFSMKGSQFIKRYITEMEAIQMPKDFFTCFFTSEAEISISEQLKQDQGRIENALKKRNYLLVFKKLGLLNLLKQNISDLSSINNQYEQNVTLIDEYINSEIQKVEDFISQIINIKKIDEQQIKSFLINKEQLSKVSILQQLLPQAENLVIKLDSALQSAITAILENAKLEINSCQQINVNEYYLKLKSLSDTIKEEKHIQQFITYVKGYIQKQVEKAKSYLQQDCFLDFFDEMQLIINYIESCSFLTVQNANIQIQQTFDSIISIMKSQRLIILEKIKLLGTNEENKNEIIIAQQKTKNILQDFKKSKLNVKEFKEKMNNFWKSLEEQVENEYNIIEQKVIAVINQESDDFSDLKSKVFQLQLLSKIFHNLEQKFNNLKNLLNDRVTKTSQQVIQMTKQILSFNNNTDFEMELENLMETFQLIQKCQWIKELDQEFEQSSQKILNQLRKFANNILGKVDQIDITLEQTVQTEDLSKIANYNQKMKILNSFQNEDKELQNIVKEYDDKVREKFKIYFDEIQIIMDSQDFTYWKLENCYHFLLKCNQNKIFKQETQKLLENLKKKILSSYLEKEKSLQDSLNQLKILLENISLTEQEKQQIQQCTKNIYQKFEEMQKIQYFDCLKSILEQSKSSFSLGQLQTSLKILWIKIKDTFDESEYIQQKWIFVLQQLNMFDELCYPSKSQFSFGNLLSDCYKKNKTNTQNLKGEIDKQLDNGNLLKILETLKSASQNKENKDHQSIFDDLKLQLENKMRQIIQKAQQTIDQLRQNLTCSSIKSQTKELIDNTNQIIILYNKFNDFELNFKDYLDIENFKCLKDQVKSSIQQIANQGLNKIKQAFKIYNFKEFYDQINFMQNIFVILQQSFTMNEQICQLSQIQGNCQEELKLLVENLKLECTNREIFNLKSVCSKLEQVEDDNIQAFSKTLKGIYQKKLEDMLGKTKEKPLNQQEKIISEVQQFFEYIPQEMENSLKQQIDAIKNTDKIKQEIDTCIRQKNIEGLKKLKASLADSSFYKQFNIDLEDFITKENENLFKQINQYSQNKNYINFEKSLLNLIKFGLSIPQDFQFISIDKLNSVLEQIFNDLFKMADCLYQQILKNSFSYEKDCLDFFSNYCELSNSLIKVYNDKLQECEQKFFNGIESFYIFNSVQKLKSDVINEIKQKVNKIQLSKQDFSNCIDQFCIVYYLQSFDLEQYRELLIALNSKQEKLKQYIESIIKQDITAFKIENEYEKYYESFQNSLSNAQGILTLEEKCNLNCFNKTLIEQLMKKLNQINSLIDQEMKQCFQCDFLEEDVVKRINNVYLNSKYIDEYLSQWNQGKNHIDKKYVELQFIKQIKEQFQEPLRVENQDINLITEYLSNMNRISQTYIYMQQVKKECDKNINKVLLNYKNSNGSLEKLQILLSKTKYGDQIMQSNPFFKGFQISNTNLRIQRFGIDEVIEQIKGYSGKSKTNDLNKTQLNDYYQRFLIKYNSYQEKYLTKFDKIDFINLLRDIQTSVGQINVKYFQETGQIQQKCLGIVSDLLAGIFCCWTCINSKYYFESIQQSYEKQQSFLLKPHAAQVIAIFRLLSIGYSIDYSKIQKNSLAQVLTGEGKSVILAALACFYSLCGFQVMCACYSNQLSNRDYEEFLPLFEKLKIKDYILYNTFNRVCEEILNERANIREQVSNYIQTGEIKNIKTQKPKKQVLLIDEVDVFFSKDFFGNNYEIVAPIQDVTVENLLDKIWSDKSDLNFSFENISQSEEYKQCIEKFEQQAELIQEQTKIVIHDFKNFNNIIVENYKIQNDKINYKNQDQYLDNISYGYRTLYTYYLENQKSRISNFSLKQQKVFKINCGSFSYSELPKKFFIIKGVTGTLETLSGKQLELIQQNYNMNQYTLIPSVYGKSKFSFNEQKDIKAVPLEEFYNTITDEINKNLVGKNNAKRAVLVFFSTKESLFEYYNSQQFIVLKQNQQTQIMTEENSIEERMKIVYDSTYSGVITLMTRIFGRGIDFKVNDITIIQNYGVHVIQTFFSEDKSEETQIKGRTARQGEDGTYSIILQKDTLQAFLKSDEDTIKINKPDQIYEVLDKNREINFENDFNSNLEYLTTSIKSHQQSETFLYYLKDRNLKQISNHLLQLNQGPKEKRNSKTLIALDVTGSMSNLITQTKNTIQTTFEQARDILKQKGYDPQCFQIMICCFRSYNSKFEEILEASSWENNPDKLRSYLQKITASGGTYPGESVEVGLWWANKQSDENPIGQVIVLGDQPAHLQNEAQSHREKHGQLYWDSTPLKGLTYYVPECDKLQSKNVPVNTFYLNQSAKQTYEEIASLTKGISQFLDINSAQSSKELTNAFVEQILKDIGKEDGRSNELIQAYKEKYS